VQQLCEFEERLNATLPKIKPKQLMDEYPVQVFTEHGISILIHVVEYFSYHTGQIALLTKLLANKSLDFYT
jgi:uncharacterized damage-inducible protein DinB